MFESNAGNRLNSYFEDDLLFHRILWERDRKIHAGSKKLKSISGLASHSWSGPDNLRATSCSFNGRHAVFRNTSSAIFFFKLSLFSLILHFPHFFSNSVCFRYLPSDVLISNCYYNISLFWRYFGNVRQTNIKAYSGKFKSE